MSELKISSKPYELEARLKTEISEIVEEARKCKGKGGGPIRRRIDALKSKSHTVLGLSSRKKWDDYIDGWVTRCRLCEKSEHTPEQVYLCRSIQTSMLSVIGRHISVNIEMASDFSDAIHALEISKFGRGEE